MGIRRGSISTPIIADGLVFNMDAANRASYIPDATTSYNTTDLSISGSFINDPTFITTPVSSSCWSFDGVDDQIDSQNISALNGVSNFTISGWFKQTTIDQNKMLFGAAYGITQRTVVYTWSDGNMYFETRNGDSSYSYFNYSTAVSNNTWFHLCWIYNGLGAANIDKHQVYIDGNKVTLSFSGTIPTSTNATQRELLIGNCYNYTDKDFLGEIANFHIYNRSLSASEVLHNYNALKGRFA